MNITVNQDKQCSICKSLNTDETVFRGNDQIIRCRICGHEKIVATMTTTNTNSEYVIYSAKKIPSKVTY